MLIHRAHQFDVFCLEFYLEFGLANDVAQGIGVAGMLRINVYEMDRSDVLIYGYGIKGTRKVLKGLRCAAIHKTVAKVVSDRFEVVGHETVLHCRSQHTFWHVHFASKLLN